MDVLGVVIVVCLGAGLLLVRRGFELVRRPSRSDCRGVKEGTATAARGRVPARGPAAGHRPQRACSTTREQRVTRALTKAGDLAHGLKTPLTLLNQQAERARAAGQIEVATAIKQQVERMRRQVDYHLAHARASASGGNPSARSHVLTSADGLARTMMTIHADRQVAIDVDVSHEHFARAQREDLDELLGNLIDNACKWARVARRGALRGRRRPVVVTVDDDGPGLAEDCERRCCSVACVRMRPRRAPAWASRSSPTWSSCTAARSPSDASPLGGLRATLRLPVA